MKSLGESIGSDNDWNLLNEETLKFTPTCSHSSVQSFDSNAMGHDGSWRLTYVAQTAFITIMFICSYGFSTISIKVVNDVYGIQAPWFTAFLSGCGFVFDLFIMLLYKKTGEIDPWRWISKAYIIVSIYASANVILTSIALNYLPGSIVMILKTTSVIMTVIEYSIFRGKRYNVYQWIAVALICTAVVSIALFSGSGETEESAIFSWNTFTILGFSCALIASLTQALKKTSIKIISQTQSHSVAGMAEGAFCNLLFCSIICVICGLISGEIYNWGSYCNTIVKKSGWTTGLIFLAMMAISRGSAFFFQWLIVRNTSATFSQVTTNFRRLLVIVILIAVLGEPTNKFTWFSVFMMLFGVQLYLYGGYVEEKKRSEDEINEDAIVAGEMTPLMNVDLNPAIETCDNYNSISTTCNIKVS